MPSTYRCQLSDETEGLSSYVVIVGDAAQYPQTCSLRDSGMRFAEVRDGMSATIMVAEIRYGVPWTMPTADLQFDTMTMRINGSPASISSRHVFGLRGDGRWQWSRICQTVSPSQSVRRLLQPADE